MKCKVCGGALEYDRSRHDLCCCCSDKLKSGEPGFFKVSNPPSNACEEIMSVEVMLYEDEEIDLYYSDGKIELDLDALYRAFTRTPRGALDIATRIIYGVWLSDPELAEERVAELANDIPDVYNLMQRHKG
jgi:hypothetical protein